ncbi:hypothetical protein GCM10009799_46290 [Nocardiopsis rhodophaea]|uniref:Uncharacterized protein n=1 Tax=Nocardiopsis rhodophaea TaxID=280238 RepID=A0ABP5F2H1_9ACTN
MNIVFEDHWQKGGAPLGSRRRQLGEPVRRARERRNPSFQGKAVARAGTQRGRTPAPYPLGKNADHGTSARHPKLHV